MYGSSWRILICIGCFYVFRFFCQVSYYLFSYFNRRYVMKCKLLTFSFIATLLLQISWWLPLGVSRLLFYNSTIWKDKRFLFLRPCWMLCDKFSWVQSQRLDTFLMVFTNHLYISNCFNGFTPRTLFHRFDFRSNFRTLRMDDVWALLVYCGCESFWDPLPQEIPFIHS